MFPLPEIISTTVFAEVPGALRRSDTTPWTQVNRGGRPTHSFLEGPSFDRAGNLYVVDVPFGRIFRISPSGVFEVAAEYDGEPNGLKIHKDGRIFITDYRNGLMILEPPTGKVTPLLERRSSERFKGLNDLFFAASGDIYFTDQGETGLQDPTGRVYHLTPDGRLKCLLHTVPSPNGVTMDLDNSALFIAATRSNNVWRVPNVKNGDAAKVGVSSSCQAVPAALMEWHSTSKAISRSRTSDWAACGFRSARPAAVSRPILPRPPHDQHRVWWSRPPYDVHHQSETGTILCARMPVAGKTMFSHQP